MNFLTLKIKRSHSNRLPFASSSCLPTSKLNALLNAHSSLYEERRKLGSSLPRLRSAMFKSRPGTSFGRIARSVMAAERDDS